MKSPLLPGLTLALATALGQPAPAPTIDETWLRANYTKFEHRIPMRDGKRLFTAVYVPKDDSKPYPILLNRTPYNVGGNYVLRTDPARHGRVVVRFVVGADGVVRSASVDSNTTGDAELGLALSEAIRRWRFPPPEGGDDVTVSFPFVFAPGD